MDTDFLDLYDKHTKEYESPGSFWQWSARCAIAATLRDNCFLIQRDNPIYPNIYVLLLADSAVHRKGNPVKFCESLVTKTHSTKVISGRSSIQAILDELARGETNKQTGKLLVGGSALFSAPELSAGIVNDPEAIKILTDIYDFKGEYTSRLRGSGTFRIKNICFTMMAASNEALLADVFNSQAVNGGLLGRTFLVIPNEFRKGNSLLDPSDSQNYLKELGEKLKAISNLRGEFKTTKIARDLYDQWYFPFRDSYKDRQDKSGVVGRIHTGVLKLAMILCVNETMALEIQERHVKQAIDECLALLPNYQKFLIGHGKSSVSEVASIVLEDLHKDGKLSETEILGRHFHQFDLESLRKCMETLVAAALVGQEIENGMMCFKLTSKGLDLLTKYIRKEGTAAK